MLKRKTIGVGALLVLCLTFIYFTNVGFRHVLPASMLRYAQENWKEGRHIDSVQWLINSNLSALNAGVRWTIADFHIKKMNDLLDEGKTQEALENCTQAVKILGGHDDEGAVSYLCYIIEERIRAPK